MLFRSIQRFSMKSYTLYQVDAFTKTKFTGNSAGVVPRADGLSVRQMQQIAREVGSSETAFAFSSPSPAYDVRVRFFSPMQEVPLCGHATVAAHYVRALEGAATSGTIYQKTKAGILPVDILRVRGGFAVRMTQGTPYVGPPLKESAAQAILEALGITQQDLREDCPVAIASAGYGKVMVGIGSLDKLHRLAPNMDKLTGLSKEIGCNGYYVFTLHPGERVLVHGRMFAPASGVPEDPVTGNANGPLGLYLVHYNVCPRLISGNKLVFTIRQGEAMGRPGSMQVQVDISNGKPIRSLITGHAVVVWKTEIVL